MYILQLIQEEQVNDLAAFETLEEGRAFLTQLDGYRQLEEEGWLEEFIDVAQLPEYVELKFNQHIIPMTRWMFPTNDRVEIEWKTVPNLSTKGNGMVDGATRVDAYSINNEEVQGYIQKREHSYALVADYLTTKGFEVKRSFKGSEDGEAILYRVRPEDDWHFLTHLEPSFFEQGNLLERVNDLLDLS